MVWYKKVHYCLYYFVILEFLSGKGNIHESYLRETCFGFCSYFFFFYLFFVLILVYKRFNLLLYSSLCLYLSEIKFYYMETFNLFFFAWIKIKTEEKDDQNVTKKIISHFMFRYLDEIHLLNCHNKVGWKIYDNVCQYR